MRTMSQKSRSTLLYVICSLIFLASIYHNIFIPLLSDIYVLRLSHSSNLINHNHLLEQQQLSSKTTFTPPSTFSVLLPSWKVLVVLWPEITLFPTDSGDFFCLFLNNEVSPARFSGKLPCPERITFTCELPAVLRRRRTYPDPVLIKSPVGDLSEIVTSPANMLRWNYLVYEAMFTHNDVVLFVKGVNKRREKNWDSWEFNCVFGEADSNAVRTAVTSSVQEVFRCERPHLTDVSTSSVIKISLEFSASKRIIPSIAYASLARKVATLEPNALLCACTMVYNVAKFLREWIIYHSKIGVDKFILYDNVSEDEFNQVVTELIGEGYNISTKFWQWPKTQEAGFSHCAIDNKDSCTWMMYVDVDEFVYSDSWSNSTSPSKSMLRSLLPADLSDNRNNIIVDKVGEIMIGCHEFGPSNQKSHPVEGVLRGYNCRKKMENRHKSIVLLAAIHDSLVNVVHHFHLKQGYRIKKMDRRQVVVNHYKFQAWPEFEVKFRRRVSTYVADWTETVNPNSQDRTPGLGFLAVEPEGWPNKFCEVHDNRLKGISKRWFEDKL